MIWAIANNVCHYRNFSDDLYDARCGESVEGRKYIFEIIPIGPFGNRKRKLKLTDSKSHLIDYTQIPSLRTQFTRSFSAQTSNICGVSLPFRKKYKQIQCRMGDACSEL